MIAFSTSRVRRASLKGQPLEVVIPRLMTLILALCDLLDQKGMDPTKLLEGLTFTEEQEPKPPVSRGRFGTA